MNSSALANPSTASSAWPHRVSALLVCATFPLVWVGGLVTTYKAGMAVPDWPSTYGYNLLLYPWQTWIYGPWNLFIEHGHRLFGAFVGLLTIALLVILYRFETRKWVVGLGYLALVAVLFQGSLGGLRVIKNELILAKVHGCVAPLFFALVVTLATVSSPWWRAVVSRQKQGAALQSLALLVTVMTYLQIVLGAQLRHIPPEMTAETFRALGVMHGLVGLAVLVAIIVTCFVAWRQFRTTELLTRPAFLLVALVVVQLALGVSTWVLHYGWPAPLADRAWTAASLVEAQSWLQSHITTAHVAVGTLILGVSQALVLRSFRLTTSERSVSFPLSSAVGAAA